MFDNLGSLDEMSKHDLLSILKNASMENIISGECFWEIDFKHNIKGYLQYFSRKQFCRSFL